MNIQKYQLVKIYSILIKNTYNYYSWNQKCHYSNLQILIVKLQIVFSNFNLHISSRSLTSFLNSQIGLFDALSLMIELTHCIKISLGVWLFLLKIIFFASKFNNSKSNFIIQGIKIKGDNLLSQDSPRATLNRGEFT